MRELMEHTRTWYVDSHSTFVVPRVAMQGMTDSNKADAYLRCLQRPNHASKTNTCIYCCNTFAEALAITTVLADSDARTAAGVSGYSESTVLDGSLQIISLTNHAPAAPSRTGLKVHVNGDGLTSSSAVDWDALYCYTADPASMVLTEIEWLLEQYVGEGQALYGFSTARIAIGEEELVMVSKAPMAIAAMADSPSVEHQAGNFAVDVNFSVIVGSRGLSSHGADNYKNVLRYAGAVRSILGDECQDLNASRRKMLNGVAKEVVIENISGPRPVFGTDEPYLAAVVSGKCRFPSMDSDAS